MVVVDIVVVIVVVAVVVVAVAVVPAAAGMILALIPILGCLGPHS